MYGRICSESSKTTHFTVICEIWLRSSRIPEAKNGNHVYFGTFSAELSEQEAIYSLPIYREGNLEEEASVTLLSVDISAKYGQDYELVSDEFEVFTDPDGFPVGADGAWIRSEAAAGE